MVQAHKNMKIDGDRLWQSLMAMAEIGPGSQAATTVRP